jgi:hypothetical protein
MKAPLTFAGLLFASWLAAQTSTQSLPSGEPKEELCSVAGVVVKAGDGTPLKRASVQLFSIEVIAKSITVHTGDAVTRSKTARGRMRISSNRLRKKGEKVTVEEGDSKAVNLITIKTVSPEQQKP